MWPNAAARGLQARTRVCTSCLLLLLCSTLLPGHALPHSLVSLIQVFKETAHAVSDGVHAAQHALPQLAHLAQQGLSPDANASGNKYNNKKHGKGSSKDAEIDDADFADADDISIRSHWALLLAGSAGWGNYRHQADACHAYQVLRKGGFKTQHMVLMVADDIASDPQNPRPGKIFNRPGGPDVYAGVTVDYRGEDVNVETFQAVLEGRAHAVKGIGSGRVIASGPRDRVFLFYSDHGAAGVLGMPSGDYLYADQLMSSLRYKKNAGGFKEMVLYIEACESGSMFEGLLDDSLNVWATTAANAEESSWGTYCPGSVPGPSEAFGTCLGDLYSVAWMENSEDASVDLRSETLKAQYALVRKRASDNNTFNMGSHVMRYGQMDIEKEAAGDYIGTNGHPAPTHTAAAMTSKQTTVGSQQAADSVATGFLSAPLLQHHAHSVRQRDADLVPLRHAVAVARTSGLRAAAQAQLDMALAARERMDDTAHAAATRLFTLPGASQALMLATGWSYSTVFNSGVSGTSSGSSRQGRAGSGSTFTSDKSSSATAADTGGGSNRLQPAPLFVEDLVSGFMGRPTAHRPLVDDWACMREMVQRWQHACGPMDQYAMRHTRFFANLCNHGVTPLWLSQALQGAPCTAAASGLSVQGLSLSAGSRGSEAAT